MRLDQYLVSQSLARSRSHAKQLISAGAVRISGAALTKPAFEIDPENVGDLAVANDGYVSRAAYKLLGALAEFSVDVSGRCALDAGASTGGFTQVLLDAGAARVLAADVGHDQLAAAVGEDSRVVQVDGLNLRNLTAETLAHAWQETEDRARRMLADIDLIVGDLSFISLTQILPSLMQAINPKDLILLIKPQFEVGRQLLEKNGLVTRPSSRELAITKVIACAHEIGLQVRGIARSSVTGTNGNLEYLLWLQPRDAVEAGADAGVASGSVAATDGNAAGEYDWRAKIPELTA